MGINEDEKDDAVEIETDDQFSGNTLEEERVAIRKGAKLLDRILPGWYNQVDLPTLKMNSGQLCMMGQLFGPEAEGELAREMYPAEIEEAIEQTGDNWGYDVAMDGKAVLRIRRKLGIVSQTKKEYAALTHVCRGHDNRCLWAEVIVERKIAEKEGATKK